MGITGLFFKLCPQVAQVYIQQLAAPLAYQMVVPLDAVISVRQSLRGDSANASLFTQTIEIVIYGSQHYPGTVFFSWVKTCAAVMWLRDSAMISRIFLAYFVKITNTNF